MKEYDNETLARIHECELVILDDFLAICEEYGLQYFALAGTILGAVRHKGFIPWDDDIDLGLPSRDLDKLVRIIQEEYSDKYHIINASTDINYPLPTTRMMLKGTQFCEETLKDIPVDLGIFLDLYGFDNVPNDEREYKRHALSCWWWSHVRLLLSIPKPVLPFRGLLRAVVTKCCQFASALFKVLGISKEMAFEKETRARNRYAHDDVSRIAFLCDTDPFAQTILKSDLFPAVMLEFEGRSLACPVSYERMLADLYGDYMQLPPEDQRKNHYPARLDFGVY